MKTKCARSLLAAVFMASTPNLLAGDAPLKIHEWGTFTSLQNKKGEAIGGINTDDEPVPEFVHRLQGLLLLSPTEVPTVFFKGTPHCHSDVTMRLETPVLYFHPAAGQTNLSGIDVTAHFRGGWLTEFYPDANVEAPGVFSRTNHVIFGNSGFGSLTSGTVGSLSWSNLSIGGEWAGPPSGAQVWTAPRDVKAAAVRTPAGESEQFLFYRGVAHIDAPIAVRQNADQLILQSQCPAEIAGKAGLKVKSLWLVDIRGDGTVAYRDIAPVTLTGNKKLLGSVSSSFAGSEYSASNRDGLKAALQSALVSEGLFADEAKALLNTWELSYFKSTGLRVFFMVPRAWTDFYLPLDISVPSKVTRVMVGRIELITPAQRYDLKQIAQLPAEKIAADQAQLQKDFYARTSGPARQDPRNVNGGSESLAAFGVEVPHSWQLYLNLGRFRNALILDAARQEPATGLSEFVRRYALEGYKPVITPVQNATDTSVAQNVR
jgi:hypothetical protein